MKIRWKIDLAMCGAFLVGLGLAGVSAYEILTRNALEDSLQNARIMIESRVSHPVLHRPKHKAVT